MARREWLARVTVRVAAQSALSGVRCDRHVDAMTRTCYNIVFYSLSPSSSSLHLLCNSPWHAPADFIHHLSGHRTIVMIQCAMFIAPSALVYPCVDSA